MALADHCPSLEVLDISCSKPYRRTSRSLRHLSLQGHISLFFQVLEALQLNCKNLSHLNLGRYLGMIQATDPYTFGKYFSKFTNLHEVSLWACKCINDITLDVLVEQCEKLTKIDVMECSISPKLVQMIQTKSYPEILT